MKTLLTTLIILLTSVVSPVFGGVGDVYLCTITSNKEIYGRSGRVDDEGFKLDSDNKHSFILAWLEKEKIVIEGAINFTLTNKRKKLFTKPEDNSFYFYDSEQSDPNSSKKNCVYSTEIDFLDRHPINSINFFYQDIDYCTQGTKILNADCQWTKFLSALKKNQK